MNPDKGLVEDQVKLLQLWNEASDKYLLTLTWRMV